MDEGSPSLQPGVPLPWAASHRVRVAKTGHEGPLGMTRPRDDGLPPKCQLSTAGNDCLDSESQQDIGL